MASVSLRSPHVAVTGVERCRNAGMQETVGALEGAKRHVLGIRRRVDEAEQEGVVPEGPDRGVAVVIDRYELRLIGAYVDAFRRLMIRRQDRRLANVVEGAARGLHGFGDDRAATFVRRLRE